MLADLEEVKRDLTFARVRVEALAQYVPNLEHREEVSALLASSRNAMLAAESNLQVIECLINPLRRKAPRLAALPSRL